MTRERALRLQRRGLGDWIALLGSSSPGAETWERDGLVASIVPSCPQRSICNSVGYRDAATLRNALDELAGAYERAGIIAWTVFVPEFDHEVIELLEAAGHRLDGSPAAMSMDLSEFEPLDLGDLDWDRGADPADVGRINDRAYGLSPDSGTAAGLSAPPDLPELRFYQSRVDGQPACVLGTIDHDGDLGFYFVATDPDHRGRGLASRLISVAIVEGRERGLETSSLQGSPMGRTLYLRLGYSEDFGLRMYERRG
jgi:GNAT superfamily N-acetyltransferase